MDKIDRSPEMLIAGYYLARCSIRKDNGKTAPPPNLGVTKWKEAYALFFEKMGNGRPPNQFANSLKNVRDSFDTSFENGRRGWVATPNLSPAFSAVFESWHDKADTELEALVLRLATDGELQDGACLRDAFRAKTEGGARVIVSAVRERNPQLRRACIELHGLRCKACGFDFEKRYGELGKDFIEVHHVTPLSERGLSETDPRTDLVPVCANCHRMIHRRPGVCYTVEHLRELLGRA